MGPGGPGEGPQRAKRAVATVVKADLSGSTQLGERLDAEDLRGVLASYFAALAHEIRRHGGTVDKYVGDGVIAVFGLPEPRRGDAVRAVRAAVEMQRAVARANVQLERRYGVRLSLRIGLHTSELAGDARGDVLPMGDSLAVAEHLEAAAPLGSAVVSEATRRAAARAFRFERAAPVTVRGRAEPIAAFRVVAPIRELQASAPPGMSASLQVSDENKAVLEEERKIVTVLFADVAPPERAGAALPPDEARAVLASYFDVVAREIRRFGGTIDKYIGDAVMAVFGAPVSHDDDGARAVGAALAIQAAIRKNNDRLERDDAVRLAVRVGVNTGEVVAGLLPGDLRAYTVTGDAVNTAQRIESATPAGEVLVSEGTRALARGAFAYEAVPPLTLKGKSQPVRAYRVLGAAQPQPDLDVRRPALVGREAELGRLRDLYALARAGTGQAVHLHGEGGVGKSRLISEFLATGSGDAAVLRTRCNSYESATPFAALADLFRRMFGLATADDEPTTRAALVAGAAIHGPVTGEGAVALILEVLGYGARSVLPPEHKRRLLLSLVRGLLVRPSETVSVVVVEDAHWIDPASADILRELRSGLAETPSLVITTSRAETPPWPAEDLPLRPLEAREAGTMVDRLAGEILDPQLRALVLERTAGNPFFIEEVLRSLRETGSSTVPATVQDVLEARLDHLDEASRLLAQRAAIVGRSFWARVLQRVTPLTDIEEPLRTLEAEHFITLADVQPERTYRFVHPLVQEVAYRTQLIARRRHAHVAIGDAIAEIFAERLEEFVDELAYQYGQGDDDTKARAALMRAGRRAQHLYAKAEALGYFRQAAERSEQDLATRAQAYEAMGDVDRVTGGYDAALSSYNEATKVPEEADPVRRGRLRRKRAMIHQLRGDASAALGVFEDVLVELPADAWAERARALLNIADVYWRDGRHEDAMARLHQAIDEGGRAGDDEAVADALKQLGTIHAYKGDLAVALRYQERSRELYAKFGDALGEANLENNIGRTERRRSRHDVALAAYERSLAIRERIGDELGKVHSHGNIAEIHYLRGDLDEAEEHYAAALEAARSIGYSFGVSAARVGRGSTRVRRGDLKRGTADLVEAIAELERTGQRNYLVEALRDLSEAYLAAGSPLAEPTARRAVALAREIAAPELTAIALQALGSALCDARMVDEAASVLEESRAILEAAGERQELGRTLGALGRVYAGLPAGDARRARSAALVGEARAILTELGATSDLMRLEGALSRRAEVPT